MSGLVGLLGDKLDLKGENVDTSSVASSAKAVGLYFSAHWCPPCRSFTPKLVEWYNKFKGSTNAKDMEIVFVSSDKEEDAFKEYYAEMPWHALPYADREKKAALSKKFKVSGIPTLLILDAKSGEVICKNARGKIDEDPEGKFFPWYPKPLTAILTGPIITKDGEKDISEVCKDKITGIYFSAHWCPPCRSFTPELVKTYNKIKEDGKDFEIIFVSWDENDEQFQAYFNDMPWTSFPHQDPRAKELATLFEVDGIPSLIIIDKDHKTVVNESARGAVNADPEGKDFPWRPKPLNELSAMTAGVINKATALVYLTGDDSKEKEAEAEALMRPIAEKYFAEQKEAGRLGGLNFFYESSNSDDLPDSLRAFIKHRDDSPVLFVISVPDQVKYIHKADTITVAEIEDVVAKYKAGTLECQPFQS